METVRIKTLEPGQRFRTAISGRHGVVLTVTDDSVVVDIEGVRKALHRDVLVYAED